MSDQSDKATARLAHAILESLSNTRDMDSERERNQKIMAEMNDCVNQLNTKHAHQDLKLP
jgi:hypothetical protein